MRIKKRGPLLGILGFSFGGMVGYSIFSQYGFFREDPAFFIFMFGLVGLMGVLTGILTYKKWKKRLKRKQEDVL